MKLLKLYAVIITKRTGHQKDNAVPWPIGAYLYWRPEIVQDNHGPGGGASYEATREPTHASFMSAERAQSCVDFMAEHYPGVHVEVVYFTGPHKEVT